MVKEVLSKTLILDHAIRLIKDEGLDALSFRSLARALGISTFPIVQHFGSKSALVLEAQEELEKELSLEVAAVNTTRHYMDLFLGYVLYAWKEPKAFPALKDYLENVRSCHSQELTVAAMKESGDFAHFTKEEFFTALGRIEIFTHGLSDLAHRGALHNPSAQGIKEFACEAINDLVFGGKHAPFID